ncbi:MAG: hypothetical protein ABI177_01835 [Edaphobacter sp.]
MPIGRSRVHLADAGFRDAVVWALDGNVRGELFYQRDGWRSDGVRRTDTVWGATVEEVRSLRELSTP